VEEKLQHFYDVEDGKYSLNSIINCSPPALLDKTKKFLLDDVKQALDFVNLNKEKAGLLVGNFEICNPAHEKNLS
jgi:hypothetical protein